MTNNFFNLPKKSHALIVKQYPLSNFTLFLKQFMKSIVCLNHGCGNCPWCKKIEQDQYYDLMIFDAKIDLKKDNVIDIQNKFIKSGLEEKNIKFLVIKNIDFANKQVLNCLLKFIERQDPSVYIIFSTFNYVNVLPTIKSRCATITITKNDDEINSFLNKIKLNEQEKNTIINCFNDFNDLKNMVSKFVEFNNLINEMLLKNNIVTFLKSLKVFKSLDYDEINLFLEIFKQKVNNERKMKIVDYQEKLFLYPNKSLLFNNLIELIKK